MEQTEISTMIVGDISTVWHRKLHTKNRQYLQIFFELYQLFLYKIFMESSVETTILRNIFILLKLSTT